MQNNFSVIKGDISSMKGDVLLNWINLDMRSGNGFYHSIHAKAGPQLQDAAIKYEPLLHNNDVFSTIAGMLEFNLVIHAIIPSDYNLTSRNIIATLKTYKRENVCRTLFLSLPERGTNSFEIKRFFEFFFLYQHLVEDISFIFVVEFESEAKLINSELKKYIKIPLVERVYSFVFKKIKTLYERNNKRKLQKITKRARNS